MGSSFFFILLYRVSFHQYHIFVGGESFFIVDSSQEEQSSLSSYVDLVDSFREIHRRTWPNSPALVSILSFVYFFGGLECVGHSFPCVALNLATHLPHLATHLPHLATHLPHLATHLPHLATRLPHLATHFSYGDGWLSDGVIVLTITWGTCSVIYCICHRNRTNLQDHSTTSHTKRKRTKIEKRKAMFA